MKKIFAALAAIFILAPCAYAGSIIPMQPGKWHVAVTMEAPMGPPIPVRSGDVCYSKSDLNENFDAQKNCHREDFRVSGYEVSWKDVCKNGRHTKATMRISPGGVSYKIKTISSMNGVSTITDTTGKRIGECPVAGGQNSVVVVSGKKHPVTATGERHPVVPVTGQSQTIVSVSREHPVVTSHPIVTASGQQQSVPTISGAKHPIVPVSGVHPIVTASAERHPVVPVTGERHPVVPVGSGANPAAGITPMQFGKRDMTISVQMPGKAARSYVHKACYDGHNRMMKEYNWYMNVSAMEAVPSRPNMACRRDYLRTGANTVSWRNVCQGKGNEYVYTGQVTSTGTTYDMRLTTDSGGKVMVQSRNGRWTGECR